MAGVHEGKSERSQHVGVWVSTCGRKFMNRKVREANMWVCGCLAVGGNPWRERWEKPTCGSVCNCVCVCVCVCVPVVGDPWSGMWAGPPHPTTSAAVPRWPGWCAGFLAPLLSAAHPCTDGGCTAGMLGWPWEGSIRQSVLTEKGAVCK